MEDIQKTVGFVSLGCDKNRVDLEVIINNFKKNGFVMAPEEEAQIVVVNTCGFVLDARRESIEAILEVAKRKKTGNLEKLIVSGCIPNIDEADELKKLLPEVDLFVKIEDQKNIVSLILKLYNIDKICAFDCKRELTTLGSMAYVKICDGCNNFCSYCRIPLIRGRFISRGIDDIVKEVQELVAGGIREIVLVGQDVTNYGKDIKSKPNLVMLLKELSKIKDLVWIRLLYCYPESITSDLIQEIKKNVKVCNYIDIPFQHINDNILKRMNRRTNKAKILNILTKLKTEIPNIAIRTTFIVGFPGETKAEFNELLNFVKNCEINYIGVFAYSKEEGTMASKMSNHLSNFTKKLRKNKLIKTTISTQSRVSKKMVDKTFMAVCHNKIGPNVYEFRTEFQAPDVDTPIYADSVEELTIGEFYNIKISAIDSLILKGEIINELT